MAAKGKKQPAQGMVAGRVEGQQVVVIPLPSVEARPSPPAKLLDEDAAEFARRPETLAPLNRSELE